MKCDLPSPPLEDSIKAHPLKKTNPGTKSTNSAHRISKRANSANSHGLTRCPISPNSQKATPVSDSRHKRVWKACERCRMKKTKCDGEFPCKRCKDDGLICTAGVRKKTEFKHLPRGYAEVLENTQFALVATVQRLYTMVRSGQSWDLGEPDLNDRGQPVIHNIAHKLGCIRPNSDIDLPIHSSFPQDERGLEELAAQLEAQEQRDKANTSTPPQTQAPTQALAPTPNRLPPPGRESRADRASSSELDHSDLEGYRRVAFGREVSGNAMTLSPDSLNYDSFDNFSVPSSESIPHATSPTTGNPNQFDAWMRSLPLNYGAGCSPGFMSQPFSTNVGNLFGDDGMCSPDYMDVKPPVMGCANPQAMLMADPLAYADFEDGMHL